jgi:hypothetical protein
VLEGRGTGNGWAIVGVAAVALLLFTGLLWIRGGNGAPIALTGSTKTPAPAAAATARASAAASALTAGASARPSAGRGTASAGPSAGPQASGAVAGSTSKPTAAPSRTPRPTRSPSAEPTDTPSPTDPPGYQLPQSPQSATVALENGQGDCPNFPTGGVVVETSFSLSGTNRLSAKSPSNQRLSGSVKADGSFSLSGASPVERWVGTLTETGGSGSYFIVSNGCTEGYETTIAFH